MKVVLSPPARNRVGVSRGMDSGFNRCGGFQLRLSALRDSMSVCPGSFKLWEGFLLAAVVGVDYLSKAWAMEQGKVVFNRGGVLGLVPSWGWIGVSLVVLMVVVYFLKETEGKWVRLGLVLIMGAGLGNLVDRVFWGAVRDFINYPWFGFRGNMADIFLTVGVGLVVIAKARIKLGDGSDE